jgi:hypothetical protein
MQPGHRRCTTRRRSTTAPSAQPTHLRASRKNNPRSPGNVPRLSRQKSHASRALRNRRAAKPANTPHTIARRIMSLNVPAAGAKSKDPKIAGVSGAVYTQGGCGDMLAAPLTCGDARPTSRTGGRRADAGFILRTDGRVVTADRVTPCARREGGPSFRHPRYAAGAGRWLRASLPPALDSAPPQTSPGQPHAALAAAA